MLKKRNLRHNYQHFVLQYIIETSREQNYLSNKKKFSVITQPGKELWAFIDFDLQRHSCSNRELNQNSVSIDR